MHVEPTDLITIAILVVLEGLLSVDNALVLAILVLGLPRHQRKKALRYGILGAFAFRFLATVFAVVVIRLAWVKLLGAVYLLYLPYRHFFSGHGESERRAVPPATPWLGLSPFWATVVRVELTDVVFAIDSVLVAVAMSPKLWVIVTGGILGIATMRLVTGQLVALVQRYPALVDGAFIIIAWVGVKLLVEYLHQIGYLHVVIPRWFSLGLIVVIFAAAFLYALRQGPAPNPHHEVDERAVRLLEKGNDN